MIYGETLDAYCAIGQLLQLPKTLGFGQNKLQITLMKPITMPNNMVCHLLVILYQLCSGFEDRIPIEPKVVKWIFS